MRVTDTTYTTDLIISGSQTAKYVLAAPNSANGAPTWRTLVASDVGLGNVENTALSTWTGSNKITTVGTIGTGTWQGTAIAATYIGDHSTDKLTSGTLGIARGGTGASSFTDNCIIVQSGTALESRGLRVAGATNANVTIEPYTNSKTLTVNSKSTLYISSAASTSLIFKVGTTEFGRFNINGMFNLGATCTQDSHKLLVNGDSAFTGKLAFTNAANTLFTYGYIVYNTSKRFIFHEQSMSDTSTTDYYENYQLPAPDDARTTNATYDILTSKAAVTVAQGGTGATSFTADSVIMSGSTTTAALTTRAVFNMTARGHLNWTATATDIHLITKNALAYWDGRYKDGKSNLTYCVKGEFGDSVVGNGRVFYGTCSTAADQAIKVITCAKYDALTVGDMIIVKFDYTNTASVSTVKLNVNSTGEKQVKKQNNKALANLAEAGELSSATIAIFVYNGTYWIFTNGDYNNHYGFRLYRQTTGFNADYPLVVSRTLAANIGTVGSNGTCDVDVYGVIWDDATKHATMNPSTGRVKLYDLTMMNKAISLQNGNSTSHLVTISAAGNTATADHTWYLPNLNSDRYFVTHNADTALGSVSQPVYISSHAAASLCTATLDLVYPVGSIYISTVADNPNPDGRADALFPNTTWVAFGKGRMLVGYDDTEGSTFGTGGAEDGHEKISLSTNNIPSHSHTIPTMTTESGGSHQHKGYYDSVQPTNGSSGRLTGQQSGSSGTSNNITQAAGAHTHTISGYATGETGSGTEFNIMNPYVVVYMWKRTE